MMAENDTTDLHDPFDLDRFTSEQDGVYDRVLGELKRGQKRTHWMWFIFPQIDGLGTSATARHYAIKNLEVARAYLRHPVIGPRLLECAESVLAIEERSASDIFGFPDYLKLKSFMTLFACVAGSDSVFARVIENYYGGEQDASTLQLLEKT